MPVEKTSHTSTVTSPASPTQKHDNQPHPTPRLSLRSSMAETISSPVAPPSPDESNNGEEDRSEALRALEEYHKQLGFMEEENRVRQFLTGLQQQQHRDEEQQQHGHDKKCAKYSSATSIGSQSNPETYTQQPDVETIEQYRQNLVREARRLSLQRDLHRRVQNWRIDEQRPPAARAD